MFFLQYTAIKNYAIPMPIVNVKPKIKPYLC